MVNKKCKHIAPAAAAPLDLVDSFQSAPTSEQLRLLRHLVHDEALRISVKRWQSNFDPGWQAVYHMDVLENVIADDPALFKLNVWVLDDPDGDGVGAVPGWVAACELGINPEEFDRFAASGKMDGFWIDEHEKWWVVGDVLTAMLEDPGMYLGDIANAW